MNFVKFLRPTLCRTTLNGYSWTLTKNISTKHPSQNAQRLTSNKLDHRMTGKEKVKTRFEKLPVAPSKIKYFVSAIVVVEDDLYKEINSLKGMHGNGLKELRNCNRKLFLCPP